MLLFPIFVGGFVGPNFDDLIVGAIIACAWDSTRNVFGIIIEELLFAYKMLLFLEEFNSCILFLD